MTRPKLEKAKTNVLNEIIDFFNENEENMVTLGGSKKFWGEKFENLFPTFCSQLSCA